MNISDLSYLEVVADTIAIHGGLFGVSARVFASSTGGATSAIAQVTAMSGTQTSPTAEINLSVTGGDFTSDVAISGLEPTDQVVVTEGDNHLNIVINPLSFEEFVLEFTPPLEFEPFFTSYTI